MFRRIFLVFIDAELRLKLLKIVGILIFARLLAHIPIPVLELQDISPLIDNDQVFGLLNTISGGSYGRLSFVMLGVGPYITASIVMQLLGVIVPKIREIQKEEGQLGQQKINKWTRYLTVPLAALNSWGILQFLSIGGLDSAPGQAPTIELPDVLTKTQIDGESIWNWFVVIAAMTAGSIIMMWLGEIITEFKMGNGVSLIILTGIVVRLPAELLNFWNIFWPNLTDLFSRLFADFSKILNWNVWKALLWENPEWSTIRLGFWFVVIFVVTLGLVIFVNDAVRKLTVVYSRRGHNEGKSRLLKNVKADLPVKVNMAGVLPIIFAVSFILFPTILSRFFFTANVEVLRETAQSVETFLSTEKSQELPDFPIPEKNFLGYYYSDNALEVKNIVNYDPSVGHDLFGFTFSTFKSPSGDIANNPELQAQKELKSVFFDGTPLRFQLDNINPGFLPEFAFYWNGILSYTLFYFILIIFFTYFYTSTVAFKTEEVSENLQKSGAYIPGFRPGEQTANYLSYISNRLNVAGSIFLAIIAVVPIILSDYIQFGDGTLTGIVGGTTLLILVSVTIESLKQIEAQATAVDYERFTKY
jgi:preprotein translocase subunit SecY